MRLHLPVRTSWTHRGCRGDLTVYAVDRGEVLVGPPVPCTDWDELRDAQTRASLPPGWSASTLTLEPALTENGWPVEIVRATITDREGRKREDRLYIFFRFPGVGAMVVLCARSELCLRSLENLVIADVLAAVPIREAQASA